MAVVQWNEAKGAIEVNTHYMSGKPRDVPFDDSYSVEVDEGRVAYLEEHLGELYPDDTIKVLGAPWDYSVSTQPELHENTAIGHYRVSIEGNEVIVAVNVFDGDEAITLGGGVFNSYLAEDIDVAGPAALPDDNWTRKCGDHYLHIERFVPGGVSFQDKDVQLVFGQPEEIGRMIGRVHNVGRSLPDDVQERLKTFTDDVTMRSWKAGLALFEGEGAGNEALLAELEGKASETSYEPGELRRLFTKAVELVKERAPAIINDEDSRVSTTFNFIDKMVKVGPDGELIFASYDTISRGYVPMVTENATHDVGFAVLRIITNPDNHHGAAGRIKDAAIQGSLKQFVQGYNEETGLNLTVQEALEAAQNVSALQMLFGMGYNSFEHGHDHTTADLVDHLMTQVIPQTERLEKLEQAGLS